VPPHDDDLQEKRAAAAVAMTRARQLGREGSLTEALAAAREALQLWPTAARHLWLCERLAAAGQVEDALAEYRAAVCLDPRHPMPFLQAGAALVRAGALAEAVRYYGDALGHAWQDSAFVRAPDPVALFLVEGPTLRLPLEFTESVLRDWLGGLEPAFVWEVLYEPDRGPDEGMDVVVREADHVLMAFWNFCTDLGYFIEGWSEDEEDPRLL
jgi:tetratricopeptide (TPR) repeat protein